MNLSGLRQWLEDNAEISFSRSSGPGGQNVNKVNTKVTVRVALRALPGIEESERLYLTERLRNRLSDGEVLVLQAQSERSQAANREQALDRVAELIERGLHRDKARRATKPSRASKEKRLIAKKIAARIKQGRGRWMDDR